MEFSTCQGIILFIYIEISYDIFHMTKQHKVMTYFTKLNSLKLYLIIFINIGFDHYDQQLLAK